MDTRKEFLAEFVHEVWSNGDIEAADKYISPQYRIYHDPGDPWEGKTLDLAGYKERVRLLRAAFPDQHFNLQGSFEDGNAIAITWLWTATHKGDIPGFPASGKQIRMSGATVYYFENGLLSGHWQITDRLGVYQQLRKQ